MRSITKKRLIWIMFVIILVWLLAFVLTQFFLPALLEVAEFESAQVIKDAVTSGIAIGTVITFVVLIVGAIVVDSFISRRRES